MKGLPSIVENSVSAIDLLSGKAALVDDDERINSNLFFASGEAQTRPVAWIKRLMDLTLALLLLCLLWPLMAAVALAIRLEQSGPLFYVSERVGRGGRRFVCYKFRTMVVNAHLLQNELRALNERDSVLFKIAGDPRVTQVGRFLRRYSLDELPQLVNVVLGQMSLIGPRPPLVSEVAQYSPEHSARLAVLPGMTGLWQVQCRNSPHFTDYINLDIEYIQHWSLWLDVKILWRTVGVVLAGTGT